jgi:hypothetical protein
MRLKPTSRAGLHKQRITGRRNSDDQSMAQLPDVKVVIHGLSIDKDPETIINRPVASL